METANTQLLDQQMSQLVNDQRDFFKNNGTRSYDFRIEQLVQFKKAIQDNEEALFEAIYDDFGKSKYDTQLTELFPVYEEIDHAIKDLDRWMKKRKSSTNLLNLPARSYLIPEPLGVTLVIGAWNFPYHLSLLPCVGAIAAGNTIILKPSELPANTSRMMAKIINENFNPEYFSVVEGGIPETSALLNQRYDKIFFTGSPQVGKIVNQAAAKHLTNVTLELGGKNPVIFSDKANLKIGVKRMIWAKFLNAGQLCITADYILVHSSVKDEFLRLAKEEIEKANFSLENNNFVKIINERNFDRVAKMIDYNKLYHGGKIDRDNRIIEPTILQDVTLDDAVMQEEVFGPILPVLTYETLDEAFETIKTFEKPLAGYIYTEDSHEKERFLNEIPFGGGAINECVMQINNPHLPFGGVGNSGIGRYHGEYSFECFSHLKAVLDKPTLIETNLKYYGLTERKIKAIRALS